MPQPRHGKRSGRRKRLFVVIGGVIKGCCDLPETGIVFVVAEQPHGIFGLRSDERQNVAGVETGNENGVIITDRFVGQNAIDLSRPRRRSR